MMSEFRISLVRALVRKILENPLGHDWSMQGFGMLRLYLAKEQRLHVWCPSRSVPGISDSSIHDHPWAFESTIISGAITDVTYEEVPLGAQWDQAETYKEQQIICGPGGCAIGEPRLVQLRRSWELRHDVSNTYHHKATDIHRTIASEGAVTLIDRTFRADRSEDRARVYWRGERWISAEPRPANVKEVREVCDRALAVWQ